MKKRLLSLVVVNIILAVFCQGCATQVPAGYRGVKTVWSKAVGEVGEGLVWYNPVPTDIYKIDCRTHKVQQDTEASSHDLQTVHTTVALNYHLDMEAVTKFYSTVGYSEYNDTNGQVTWSYVDKVIAPRIDEVIKAVTPQYKASELITKRAEVKMKVEEELKKRLATYYIIVEPAGVSLTDFSFSEAFDKSIEEKQIAEQRAQKAEYELQQAKVQKEIAVTEAEGKAAANQALTSSLSPAVLQQMWIEKWDGHLPQAAGADVLMSMPGVSAKTSGTK